MKANIRILILTFSLMIPNVLVAQFSIVERVAKSSDGYLDSWMLYLITEPNSMKVERIDSLDLKNHPNAPITAYVLSGQKVFVGSIRWHSTDKRQLSLAFGIYSIESGKFVEFEQIEEIIKARSLRWAGIGLDFDENQLILSQLVAAKIDKSLSYDLLNYEAGGISSFIRQFEVFLRKKPARKQINWIEEID